MADFNPQITPFNDPFREATRPVPGPAANTSTELALKTAGTGITGIAKIADEFMQNKVKNEATEGVDSIRDIFTQTLKTATQPQNTIPAPAQTAGGAKVDDPSLLDSNASADVPAPIQNGLQRVGVLNNARIASSGAKDDLYTGQLNSLAVRLRTQYPGYRPYIDEQISQMTGMNPANAQINSMLADLKTNQASQEKIKTDAYNDIRGLAGATVDGVTSSKMAQYLLNNWNNPQAVSNVNEWMFRAKRTKSESDEKTLLVTQQQQDYDQLKARASSLFETNLDGMFNNHFYAHAKASDQNPSRDADMLADAMRNPGTYTTDQISQATMRMSANRDAMISDMRSEAGKLVIDPTTGKPALDSRGNTYSMNSLLGADAEARIQRKADGYNTVIKAATDKDVGTATYTARYGINSRSDLDHGIISKPENQALTRTEWMGTHMPQGVQGQVLTEAMTAGIGKTLGNVYTDKTLDMMVPGNVSKRVASFKQDIIDLKNSINTGDASPEEKQKLAEGLVNNIKYLGNEPMGPKGVRMDDATQMRIASNYFNPRNRDVLQQFKQGYYKDATGNPVPDSIWNSAKPGLIYVPGREAVWDKLTNPKVTDNMARLAKLPGGAKTAGEYVNWAESEHSQMATTAIKTLNEIQDDARKGVGIDLKKGLDVHLKWNSDSGEFTFIDKNENPIKVDPNAPPDPSGIKTFVQRAQPTLDKINSIGKNMMQIQDSLGNKQGMSAYYLDLLQREGFRPNENLSGMDQKFYDAIAAGHKQNRIEDVFKKGLGNN